MADADDNPFTIKEQDAADNPFAEGAPVVNGSQGPKDDAQPLMKQPAPEAERVNAEERRLAEKERLLAQREAALREREQTMKDREADVVKQLRVPNFPPCKPMVYHNIEDDIPIAQHRTVNMAFQCCVGTQALLCFNFFTILILYGTPEPYKGSNQWQASGAVFWAMMYCICGVPGAWYLWYSYLYDGFRQDSSASLVLYFITKSIHIFFAFLVAFGFPGCAGAGLLAMTSVMAWEHEPDVDRSGHTVGDAPGYPVQSALCVVNTICWMLVLGASLKVFQTVHKEYQMRGVDGVAALRSSMTRSLGRAAASDMLGGQGNNTAGGALSGSAAPTLDNRRSQASYS
jgi:hypothetical protein